MFPIYMGNKKLEKIYAISNKNYCYPRENKHRREGLIFAARVSIYCKNPIPKHADPTSLLNVLPTTFFWPISPLGFPITFARRVTSCNEINCLEKRERKQTRKRKSREGRGVQKVGEGETRRRLGNEERGKGCGGKEKGKEKKWNKRFRPSSNGLDFLPLFPSVNRCRYGD